MVTNTILLTRPIAASRAWALQLAERGFECIIEPLLKIEATTTPPPVVADCDGLILTSAHAVPFLPANKIDLPCFVVGAATAHAAQAAGYQPVLIGKGNSSDLAHLITALPQRPRHLLHVCGEDHITVLHERLNDAGITVTLWEAYRAQAVIEFSPFLCEALAQKRIRFIPLFSPRSAQLLVKALTEKNLTRCCDCITVVALSEAIAEPLQSVAWHKIIVAPSPCADALLACLEEERDRTI